MISQQACENFEEDCGDSDNYPLELRGGNHHHQSALDKMAKTLFLKSVKKAEEKNDDYILVAANCKQCDKEHRCVLGSRLKCCGQKHGTAPPPHAGARAIHWNFNREIIGKERQSIITEALTFNCEQAKNKRSQSGQGGTTGTNANRARLWTMHKRWEWMNRNRNRIPEILNSSVEEKMAFWNEANAYAGIDQWERLGTVPSLHPACLQWREYNGLDPMLRVSGATATAFGDLAHSPSELVELCNSLAIFQKPYLVAMGLLNEDNEPIAVVPGFHSGVDWQKRLSPKMRVFMEQIIAIRLSSAGQRRDGDLRDILIKQG